jgi:PHD/YefM family antitoxin component YafN of YafNO toxin-antitoxin module
MVWQECDAAERFEEFNNAAVNEGPQAVIRGGAEAAVLVSVEEWAVLKAKSEKMEAMTGSRERR